MPIPGYLRQSSKVGSGNLPFLPYRPVRGKALDAARKRFRSVGQLLVYHLDLHPVPQGTDRRSPLKQMKAPDFVTLFGHSPSVTADAPGRVNLIGEHTDYNGGFVLPTAIPQRTQIELRPRHDDTVRVWSAGMSDGADPQEFTLGAEQPGRGWLDYVQGLTKLLRAGGHELSGFDARITSNVPVGSGLSSSAALSVSLLRALRQAFALKL